MFGSRSAGCRGWPDTGNACAVAGAQRRAELLELDAALHGAAAPAVRPSMRCRETTWHERPRLNPLNDGANVQHTVLLVLTPLQGMSRYRYSLAYGRLPGFNV
eukprot:scpid64044/ scgid30048/ 